MTQIPEGRQPMQSDDMAKLHPSTWEQQCAQLVAEKAELALQATIALSERDELLAENERLRARVAELEAVALDYRHVLHSAKAGRDLYCGMYVAKEYKFTREQIDTALAKISAALQKQEGGE